MHSGSADGALNLTEDSGYSRCITISNIAGLVCYTAESDFADQNVDTTPEKMTIGCSYLTDDSGERRCITIELCY
ncbi:hypothetical protein DPMN_046679 [Dreissena polymorpha]|uniref:Uncharacterized protein n=1 Tax=Dreissena polymorpha TaxID=45954 RepID=A0A9D4I140_DREPO|nr:hypothetical protein DPMN_046679 [Dreissena polymorpha]